jgi:Fe-S oxidoreductase/nitrate reductase gamma subunit
MPQPLPADEITREIMWNVGTPAKVAMYSLFVVSTVIAAYGFYRRWQVWQRGKPSGVDSGGVSGAVKRLARHVLAQLRIARIPAAWISHMALFYGFIVLFIGTVIVALEHYGIFHLFGIAWVGNFYTITSFAMDLFGLGFVIALVVAMARRFGLTRVKPSSKKIDALILWLFLLIGVSGFVVEALRVAYDFPSFERSVSFVAWWMATGFRAVGIQGDAVLPWHAATWWFHMVLVFAFIAMVPYSKLLHVLIAPVNIALTPEHHSGHLPMISLEEVEETGEFGVDKIADFTRGQLLSFDACTHCRRCETACPAYNTDKPLSPMRVILDIAEHGRHEGSLHGDVISAETLWACTTCGACVYECPVLIDQMGTIVQMRRLLVGEGKIVGSSQSSIRAIAAHGNPWGLPREERADWAEGLDVPTTEEKDSPEVLFWVGCAGSYDRRNQEVTRAMVKIFNAAGVNYAILGKKESCTGDPARRVGDEFTFMEQAMGNVETLSKVKFQKVVTACAHCFNTLANEYPDYEGTYEVVHHTQFVNELMAQGRLTLADLPDDASGPVTLHDPCYVSRHNRLPEAPHGVLEAVAQGGASGRGLPIVEPEKSGCNTFCCGAGGGRMWVEEDIDKRVNVARFNQLKQTGAKTVATACPFCMTMMDDASKNDEAAGIVVKDLAELVAQRLPGE